MSTQTSTRNGETQIVKRIPARAKLIKTRIKIQREKRPGSKIDWKDAKNIACVVMAGLGYSNRFIFERTQMTPGKIAFRMRVLGVEKSRRDYREGKSSIAKKIIHRFTPDLTALLEEKTRRLTK